MQATRAFEPIFDELDDDLRPKEAKEILFADSEEESLFRVASFAENTRDFLRTEVGRYIKGRAIQEIRDAQQALLVVSPWNRWKIHKIQRRAQAARSTLEWINEILVEGDIAYQAMEDRSR